MIQKIELRTYVSHQRENLILKSFMASFHLFMKVKNEFDTYNVHSRIEPEKWISVCGTIEYEITAWKWTKENPVIALSRYTRAIYVSENCPLWWRLSTAMCSDYAH